MMAGVANLQYSLCKISQTWSFKPNTFLFPRTQTAKSSTKTKPLSSTLSRCHLQFFSPLPPHNTSSSKPTKPHVEASNEYNKLKALLEILMENDCCPLQVLRDDGDWTKDQFWAVIRFLIHASRPKEILQVCCSVSWKFGECCHLYAEEELQSHSLLNGIRSRPRTLSPRKNTGFSPTS